MQLGTSHFQLPTCDVPCATSLVNQRILELATCNFRRATCNLQLATSILHFRMCRLLIVAACIVQLSTTSMSPKRTFLLGIRQQNCCVYRFLATLLFVCVDIRSALHRLVGMLTISKFSTMLCSGWTRVIRCHFCSPVALPSASFHSFFLGCPFLYNIGFCSFSLGGVVGRLRWKWPPAQSRLRSCRTFT